MGRALDIADDIPRAAGSGTGEQSRRWAMATAFGRAAADHRDQWVACMRHCWSDMPSALGFAQGYLEAARATATNAELTALATAVAEAVERALPPRPGSTGTA